MRDMAFHEGWLGKVKVVETGTKQQPPSVVFALVGFTEEGRRVSVVVEREGGKLCG